MSDGGKQVSKLMDKQNADKWNREGHGLDKVLPGQRHFTGNNASTKEPFPTCQCSANEGQDE